MTCWPRRTIRSRNATHLELRFHLNRALKLHGPAHNLGGGGLPLGPDPEALEGGREGVIEAG